MTIQVGAAGPPHREGTVAEFHIVHDGFVDVPAELFRVDGRMMIAIYSREGGPPWEFHLSEFLEAVGKGIAILGS